MKSRYLLITLPFLIGCKANFVLVEKTAFYNAFPNNCCASALQLKARQTIKDETLKVGNFTILPDDVDIFNSYSNKDKIRCLEYLLRFQGDTSVTNKLFRVPETLKYTKLNSDTLRTEIEALYIFTTLVISDPAGIKPQLHTLATNSIVTKRNDIDKIYDIYRQWLNDNKKNNFITVSYPLENSNFKWLGEEEDSRPTTKMSL